MELDWGSRRVRCTNYGWVGKKTKLSNVAKYVIEHYKAVVVRQSLIICLKIKSNNRV